MTEGVQNGMIMDFGFLKTAMMDVIDAKYDHSLCLWHKDPITKVMETHASGMKLIKVGLVPTAENLAYIWYEELDYHIKEKYIRSDRAWLKQVTVYETPNCCAVYDGTQ